VAIPAAFLVSGLTGVLMERTIIRFLYGRPLETLLATFGVSLVLQQTVRSIFSALNRSVVTPDWMSGSLRLNDALAITLQPLYIVIFTLIVFSLIMLVLKRTRSVSTFGLFLRIEPWPRRWDPHRVGGCDDLRAWSRIAGVAGVALSQLTNVGPNLGQSYIIDSFMVVVLAALESVGLTHRRRVDGIVNQLLEPFSGAVLAKISSWSR